MVFKKLSKKLAEFRGYLMMFSAYHIELVQGHGWTVLYSIIGSTCGQLSTSLYKDAHECYLWKSARTTTKRRQSHSLCNVLSINSKTFCQQYAFVSATGPLFYSKHQGTLAYRIGEEWVLGQVGSGKLKIPG